MHVEAARYLNLACGNTFHSDWENVDSRALHPSIKRCDLKGPLPYAAAKFEVVYSSHFIEHLDRSLAPLFLAECFRVLKPNGILRVVVPNLEEIARLYLQSLENIDGQSLNSEIEHQWMVNELFDQMVRRKSGGEMLSFSSRMKDVSVWAKIRISAALAGTDFSPERPSRRRLSERFLVRLIGNGNYQRIKQFRFQESGELHRWMYDRHSLAVLLRDTGFVNVTLRSATESQIVNWADFHLDTDEAGKVRKPDSLYMEGVKPGNGKLSC